LIGKHKKGDPMKTGRKELTTKDLKISKFIKVEYNKEDSYFEVSTEIKFKVGEGKKLVEYLNWTKLFRPYDHWETDMDYYEMKKNKIFLGFRTYDTIDIVNSLEDFLDKVLTVKKFKNFDVSQ
jgi:hypothetical protein